MPRIQKYLSLFSLFFSSCQTYFDAIVLYIVLPATYFIDAFFFFLPWLNVPKTKVVFLQLSEADANKVN